MPKPNVYEALAELGAAMAAMQKAIAASEIVIDGRRVTILGNKSEAICQRLDAALRAVAKAAERTPWLLAPHRERLRQIEHLVYVMRLGFELDRRQDIPAAWRPALSGFQRAMLLAVLNGRGRSDPALIAAEREALDVIARDSQHGSLLTPILLAVAGGKETQFVRLGKTWVKDRRGRKRQLKPFGDLPMPDGVQWSQQRRNAIEDAEAHDEPVIRRDDALDRRHHAGEIQEGEMPSPADPWAAVAAKQLTSFLQQLPPQQRKIVEMLGAGYKSREIAARLGITTDTVKKTRQHIREKIRKNIG